MLAPFEPVFHTYETGVPLAVNVAVFPAHIIAAFTLNVGKGFTVTALTVVFTQPLSPVMVYVVVTVGLATTLVPLILFNPLAGLHVYVVAPLAVKVVVPFKHIADTPDILIVGVEFMLTTTVLVLIQLFISVPLTV